MRLILEFVTLLFLLLGAGKYTADFLLKELKTAVAEKIIEHDERSLHAYSQKLTGPGDGL